MSIHLPDNNHALLQIATANKMSKHDVANVLNVTLSTVEKWRMPVDAPGYRRIRSGTLEQFKLLIYVRDTVPVAELKRSNQDVYVTLKVGGLL